MTSLFGYAVRLLFLDCELSTVVVGQEISVRFILAPVGYSRLMHPEGELAAARAASEVGTGYILSTISGHNWKT